jgi:uncharacterized Zn finger protein
MNFGEISKNISEQERTRLNELADKLDELQKAWTKRFQPDEDKISYVNWIVQDLRKGDLETAKVNYEQQRDKYDDKKEIVKFLEDNEIASKGIDWAAWGKSDSYDDYSKSKE